MIQELINQLNGGEATVKLTKLSGGRRTMVCTWGERGKVDGNVVRVFDVESNEYRSIRPESILEVR